MSITVDFTFSVSEKTVRFTDRTQSSASIAYRKWNFGDGRTASATSPSHTYPAYSTSYTVSLEVMNTAGDIKTVRKTVRTGSGSGGGTTCPTPTASFRFSPSSPKQGDRVTFNPTAGSGGSGATVTDYSWEYGDGQSGRSNYHTYNRSGTFTVKLTVTNSCGNTRSTTSRITVTGTSATCPTPTASFTFSPSSPKVGARVTFNPSAGSGGSGATVSDYSWDYGDGGSGRSNYHTYTRSGTFTAKLTVTNSCGKTKTVTRSISVSGTSSPSTFDVYITAPTGASISVRKV